MRQIKLNVENVDSWNAILVRIRFLKALLNIINILASINLSEQKLGIFSQIIIFLNIRTFFEQKNNVFYFNFKNIKQTIEYTSIFNK